MVTSYTRVIQRGDFGSAVVYENERELRGMEERAREAESIPS